MSEPYITTLVKIMGSEYPIRSDADADYLLKLAKYVEEKIQSISSRDKLPQKMKSEVLAAILIADEFFGEKERNEKTEGRMQQLLSVIEDRLANERP